MWVRSRENVETIWSKVYDRDVNFILKDLKTFIISFLSSLPLLLSYIESKYTDY